MKQVLLLWVLLMGFIFTSCEYNKLAEEEPVDELMLIPKDYTTNQKAKTRSNQATSSYSCLISTLADDKAEYNYWNRAFWVHFPKPAIEQAEGRRIFKAFSFSSEYAGEKAGSWAGKDNIVRVAQCEIPDSKLAETLLEEQLIKFGKETWLESRREKSVKNGVQTESTTTDWECGEWYVVYLCLYDEETDSYYNCVQSDPICAYYVYVEESDPGGGGGGPGGFPGDDPGECDPMGTEPCVNDPGGGSSPPPDPCHASNPPDYCSEPDLCIGNPLPNPEITPSGEWNTQGGMYGWTRSSGNQFHDGIDLSAEVNTQVYSMHSGTVVAIENGFNPGEYKKRSYGNFVDIESVLNGETIRFRYAHLNSLSVQMNAVIYAGQKIGLTGNTGNAQTKNGIKVLPHVHVRARKVVNGQESKTNPNNYMATKFNSDGSVNTAASTCNN